MQAALSPHPAQGWLRLLSRAAPVDYLTVVEYPTAGGRTRAPRFVEGWSAPGIDNVTAECFGVYRQHYWRNDEATRLAQYARGDDALTALYCHATELQEPWRRDVYDPANLEGRLSLMYQPSPGTTAVLNLYRLRSSGPFASREIEDMLEVAPLVQLAHRISSQHPARRDAATDVVGQAERRLRTRLPELSDRERQVCARIACGMSRDGIAADLDIAPSSVATLRKRSYAKLAARGVAPGRAQLARIAE